MNKINPDPTLDELRKIFIKNGLEFFIKKKKGSVVKVHFMVNTDDEENT